MAYHLHLIFFGSDDIARVGTVAGIEEGETQITDSAVRKGLEPAKPSSWNQF